MGRQRRPARNFDAAGAAFRFTHLHKALGLLGLIFPEFSPLIDIVNAKLLFTIFAAQ
jgi:hypothetical protein